MITSITDGDDNDEDEDVGATKLLLSRASLVNAKPHHPLLLSCFYLRAIDIL